MRISRRTVLASAAAMGAAAAFPTPALTQTLTRVRFMMDWAWQGPQAFAALARDKGYFREEGVDIVLDRGRGSGVVPVELAGGNYQMGYADLSPMVRFVAERPDTGIQAVAVLAHNNALSATVRADSAIRTPKDLEGKTLAAPEVDAGRQLFPAFAKAAGFDASKITWMTVTPDLREPMLVQRRADGVTGFVTSTAPSLARLGLAVEQQRIFRYREFGVDFYSSAIMTTRRFAQENPAAVRGVVRAMIRGFRDAIANHDEAMAALQRQEPLTDVPVERARWVFNIQELLDTPQVRANGIAVDMARLQRTIVMVEEAFGRTPSLQASAVYTPEFLPRETRELAIF